jgi:hypothetical protein
MSQSAENYVDGTHDDGVGVRCPQHPPVTGLDAGEPGRRSRREPPDRDRPGARQPSRGDRCCVPSVCCARGGSRPRRRAVGTDRRPRRAAGRPRWCPTVSRPSARALHVFLEGRFAGNSNETRTVCYASTSPREPTSPAGVPTTSSPSKTPSTADPRKILGWKTPAEALDEQLRSLQHAGVATTGRTRRVHAQFRSEHCGAGARA